MRQLIQEDAFALEEADGLFWHRISDFSKWAYFWLIFRVFTFLMDWVFDIILMCSFAGSKEWVEFTETLTILIAALLFQLYHYNQEQTWIDANHKVLRTPDCTDGEPEHENSPTPRTPSTSKQKNGHRQRGSDVSNSPILGREQSENPVGCCNNRSVWQYFRCVAKWTVVGLPLFRAVANWKDLKEKEKLIEARRASRKQVDTTEVAAAVTKSERDITEQTFQIIEQFFEALPQAVMQVYLAARANETLRVDSYSDWARLTLILVCLLVTSFSSTKYMLDYCRHLKTLHFQDYLWFNYRTDFAIVDWTSTFMLFFMHLITIVTRFYGISYVFVVYGQVHGVFFVTLLYFIQYTWLQLQPSSRLMYENPPRGITTNYSNIIDRWTNVFTFHMIKPSVRTIALFNALFFVATAVFTVTFNTISNTLSKAAISNHFFNYTQVHQVGNDTSTSSAMTYYSTFACFPCVLLGWTACFLINFGLSWGLESRMQPFFKSQFPLSKGFPFWQKVMKCMTWEKVDPKFRRYICLCLLATDEEFTRVFNVFCCNVFCNLAKPRPSDEDLEDLWDSILSRMQSGVEVPLPLLKESWELVRRDRLKINFMEGLLELVESAFQDGEFNNDAVIPREHLEVFLILMKNFELNLSERNSLRLHRTEEFINELRKDSCAQINGEWIGSQV